MLVYGVVIFLAVISTTLAAPWRCVKTQDGGQICFGDIGQPTIAPPSISIRRPQPPCSCPATIITPPDNPNPGPLPPYPSGPCPSPIPPPCPMPPSPCPLPPYPNPFPCLPCSEPYGPVW